MIARQVAIDFNLTFGNHIGVVSSGDCPAIGARMVFAE